MRDSLIRALVPSPAVSAALAAFLATLGRPNNPDTLWHLALGRWIVTHRALPDISQFYYSATTGPGYDYAWLAQALLFGAHQLLGSAGIAVLNSAVAGFVFYFLYRLLEHESSNLVVNFAVLGLALAAITTYLSGRPVIFTLALFTLELFILSEFTASVTRRAWSCVWLIPLFTALWANLHPGFVLAPLVVLAFLPLVKGWRRWVLAGVAASAVVAVLLNPYGWRLYLVPLETLKALPMLRSLTEWTGIAGGEAVLWGGLVALGTWGCAVRRQPASIVLLFGLSALAAGVSDRNLPLFGVVMVFVLGRTLVPMFGAALRERGLLRRFELRLQNAGGWVWLILLPLATALLRPPVCDLSFNFRGYPVRAVRYLEQHNCPDNVFVRETWSGYLLWAMPHRKLFYDAKGGFSQEATRDHAQLTKLMPGWRSVAERNGLETCLLERNSPFAVVLSETDDWCEVYADSLTVVYEHLGRDPRDEQTQVINSRQAGGSGMSPEPIATQIRAQEE